jgi:hypothetical protein
MRNAILFINLLFNDQLESPWQRWMGGKTKKTFHPFPLLRHVEKTDL